jgi:hypothetical protein
VRAGTQWRHDVDADWVCWFVLPAAPSRKRPNHADSVAVVSEEYPIGLDCPTHGETIISEVPATASDDLDHLSFPEALRPPISIGLPNEPITLYTGPVDFNQAGEAFRADARISLAWLPSPEIRFEVPQLSPVGLPKLDDVSFRLDDGTAGKRGLVTGSNLSTGTSGHFTSLSGIVAERVIRPADGPVSHVLFLVPNFPFLVGQPIDYPGGVSRRSRLSLAGCGWAVTLDAVQNQKDVQEFLESRSGFGVTHIGRLEKEDGQSFSAGEALPVLEALVWYLSFAAGSWTGPCLPTGLDGAGKQIWQVWESFRPVPFVKRRSWLNSQHGAHFEAPFPGFMKRWSDKDWQEVIRVAVHWYVEANAQASAIEGSIVLTQTAFELLASAVLVERHGWLSTDGYGNLAAADRIRLLFLWAGIPTAIPPELGDLTRQAKADNWPDTATAMAMIRNTITHPTKKNREKFGKHLAGARAEAWVLGLWHLELCLLRLFDYRGQYGNRIKQRYAWQIEQVPWALEAT